MKKQILISALALLGATIAQAQENTAIITSQEISILPESENQGITEILDKHDLKEFNREQTQIQAERKIELKRQKEIAKHEKNIAKLTKRLDKTKNNYSKRDQKLSNQLIKGKVAPVQELKEKQRLHKLQTQIVNLEFQLKTAQAKYEALTK